MVTTITPSQPSPPSTPSPPRRSGRRLRGGEDVNAFFSYDTIKFLRFSVAELRFLFIQLQVKKNWQKNDHRFTVLSTGVTGLRYPD